MVLSRHELTTALYTYTDFRIIMPWRRLGCAGRAGTHTAASSHITFGAAISVCVGPSIIGDAALPVARCVGDDGGAGQGEHRARTLDCSKFLADPLGLVVGWLGPGVIKVQALRFFIKRAHGRRSGFE